MNATPEQLAEMRDKSFGWCNPCRNCRHASGDAKSGMLCTMPGDVGLARSVNPEQRCNLFQAKEKP